MIKIKIYTSLFGFFLLLISASAREIELIEVKLIDGKVTPIVKKEHEGITCSFESVLDLDKGKILLAIRLQNSRDELFKVSKYLLGLDESYELKFNDNVLPNEFSNHQSINQLEADREKLGTRWLIVPPKGSILLSFDPVSWQALEDLGDTNDQFEVVLTSYLFHSQKVLLKFKVLPE
jgi:hypothetical protein